VLVHAGVCDARMWEDFPLTGATTHELRGFGDTPLPASGTFSNADDLEAALGGRPAALVGASYGGQVCLELTARAPGLVTRLVLLNASLPDHEPSAELLAFASAEERLVQAGDLDAATELNVDFWAGGASAEVREAVRTQQRRAFELQHGETAEETGAEAIDLAAVRAPTLVAVGEHDNDDFKRIAERLAGAIAGAELVVIEGAGHLPALERPEATARLVREFLAA
jgi:3-oxoadipate enol-lactonase